MMSARLTGRFFLPGGALRAALLLLTLATSAFPQPPSEKGSHFLPNDLVALTSLDSTIRLDIRYATSANFMHRPMYQRAAAFLQRPAAEALVRVSRAVHKHGLGLLVFDAYRPWSVTKQFWDETPTNQHNFVADPKKGSVHNRGCAVDLSLYDRTSGKEIIMPSPFDDFTINASPNFAGGTKNQRAMRDLLRHAMEREGFRVDKNEWWHFSYREWRRYRVLDIPFEKISL